MLQAVLDNQKVSRKRPDHRPDSFYMSNEQIIGYCCHKVNPNPNPMQTDPVAR
jgi:hypothetical protein